MEWTSFFTLFFTLFSSLQERQKLQYLKASKKGDAAKLLASIPVTDHKFDIAMNTLINRYENKRIIIRTHLHSIVSYRSLTTDNARDLRSLIEVMDEHRLALQSFGEPVKRKSKDISSFFVYLISEKLPTETKKTMGAIFKRQGTSNLCRAQTFFRGTHTITRGNSANWVRSDKNSSERESTTFAHTFRDFRATMRMV